METTVTCKCETGSHLEVSGGNGSFFQISATVVANEAIQTIILELFSLEQHSCLLA